MINSKINQIDKAKRHEQLKEALIVAATRTIESQGLAGLKARTLADEVGCAVGAIYNVVADLDELVLLVNARTLTALERTLSDASSQGRDPDWAIAQLVKLALAYLEFAAGHRRLWSVLFEYRMPPGQELPDWFQQALTKLFAYVEGPVAVLAPKADAALRALLARSLFSAVHGMVTLGLEEKLQRLPLPTLRAQITTVVTAFGHGLAGGE